jgi:hypothetical protein
MTNGATNMVRLVMLAAAMLTAATVQVWSQESSAMLIGFGTSSCGTWRQVNRASSEWFGIWNWVLGYVSGQNFARTGNDFLKQTDADAIIAWMDDYCRSHPLEKVVTGANNLVTELQSRMR